MKYSIRLFNDFYASIGTIQASQYDEFYVISAKRTKFACELQNGDQIQLPDGSLATVSSISQLSPPPTIDYNPSSDAHTYFVEDGLGDAASQNAVWVHNDSCRLGFRLAFKNRKLANELKRIGYEAHHIVPENLSKFASAVRLREKLAALNIPLDSRMNGVWLEGRKLSNYHSRLHTEEYCKALEKRLSKLNTRFEIVRELKLIGKELQNMEFHY